MKDKKQEVYQDLEDPLYKTWNDLLKEFGKKGGSWSLEGFFEYLKNNFHTPVKLS